ncbi:hypothetical protein AB7W12_22130, partial [Providencia rettgeri]
IVPPMKKLLWQMTSLFSMCGSLTAYNCIVRERRCIMREINTVIHKCFYAIIIVAMQKFH